MIEIHSGDIVAAALAAPLARVRRNGRVAMVPGSDVHKIMDELYEVGARAILVTDIHACRL